jgi:hypothetical protein
MSVKCDILPNTLNYVSHMRTALWDIIYLYYIFIYYLEHVCQMRLNIFCQIPWITFPTWEPHCEISYIYIIFLFISLPPTCLSNAFKYILPNTVLWITFSTWEPHCEISYIHIIFLFITSNMSAKCVLIYFAKYFKFHFIERCKQSESR